MGRNRGKGAAAFSVMRQRLGPCENDNDNDDGSAGRYSRKAKHHKRGGVRR